MLLYLIRHAHAVDAAEDPERPLSRRGIAQVRALTNFLKGSDEFAPDEIWHSPLLRSQETAELLKQGLRLKATPLLVPGLEPDDDPAAIARRLTQANASVAIVGHEPHLSALASLLVAGQASPPRFVMKKGSILALEGLTPYWMVRWHLRPDLLP